MIRSVSIALVAVLLLGACSSSDSDDQRITRIDGPASVDDDNGADNGG